MYICVIIINITAFAHLLETIHQSIRRTTVLWTKGKCPTNAFHSIVFDNVKNETQFLFLRTCELV